MTLRSLVIFMALTCPVITWAQQDLTPSTNYTPQEVVKIVIHALKHNDPDSGDKGIATVYRFASPANRTHTGPLDRFTHMIKHGFPEMLNHTDSEFGEMKIDGITALQVVWLTTKSGDEVGYLFQIGKQSDVEHDGVWMTEAVYPQPDRGQSI